MITEVAAKAAEVISNAAHAVGEAAKAGIEHVQQTAECDVNELKVNRTIIAKPDFLYIKETTLQKLEATNASTLETIAEETHAAAEGLEESTSALSAEEGTNEINGENPLTDVERSAIMEETGWSEDVVNCIETQEQYELYRKADLHEAVVDERKCLVKDIDLDYVDEKTGLTNRELMENGLCPVDAKTGETIELHHMGQDYESPFAELCSISEHRGEGVDTILHDKNVVSWRQDPEKKSHYCNVERPRHWRNRFEEAA